jgi:hypothetical protein
MGLGSVPGIIFTLANSFALFSNITNISLMHVKDDDKDETQVRLLIVLYLDAAASLLTLIMAIYSENIIDNDPDSGISTQMVGFMIITIKLLLCVPMIVLMPMVKEIDDSYYIILLVLSTIICNVVMFLTYPFAVEENWF